MASSDEEGYDIIARSYGDTTLYVGMNINDTAKEVKVPVNANAGDTVKIFMMVKHILFLLIRQ